MTTTKTTPTTKLAVHFGCTITTDHWTATVYEPSEIFGPHSSIGAIDSVREALACNWPGAVMSRRLPAEIDALPVGEARFEAIHRWRTALAEICYEAIRRALPEYASAMTLRDGEGQITLPGSMDTIRKNGYTGSSRTITNDPSSPTREVKHGS